MMMDWLFGDSCSAVRSDSGDALQSYRVARAARNDISRDDSSDSRKAEDFTKYAGAHTESAVRAYDSKDGISLHMLLHGTDYGRHELNKKGEPKKFDGIEDGLRLAREFGATGKRIDNIETCVTMLGKWIHGKDYKLPHKR